MRHLSEIVDELVEDIGPTLEQRGIEFSLNRPDLPPCSVPHFPALTVLRNISQNAVDAMPDGGSLQIDLSLDRDDVVILVADTGCGLDEGAKSRIFEPFWSTKGIETSGTEGGVGLGLAIAHGLVQMMHGTISVTSEVGQGSCFRVTFPMRGVG